MKQAAIMGASGTIGSAISKALKQDLWKVIPVDRKGARGSGHIDALICCAGVSGALVPFEETTTKDLAETLLINFLWPVKTIRAALPHMPNRGRIITFFGGGEKPMPNASAYCASKYALWRFTECLAAEVYPNILVNCIAPGPVVSKLWAQFHAAGLAPDGGTPENTVELVRWLLSKEADDVTGRLISAQHDDWTRFIGAAPECGTLRRVKPFPVESGV